MVEVVVDVDADMVWEKVWGNDGQGFAYWVSHVTDVHGNAFHAWLDTDKPLSEWRPNVQNFRVFDAEGGREYKVTVYQLVQAWANVLRDELEHCGGDSVHEHDACVEDYIMQYAVFGDLVYG